MANNRSTFRPNSAGLRELLTSGQLTPALEAQAQPIAARARANAPVESAASAAERDRTPGRFRDSIHTERHRSPSRVTVRVVADSDAANIIERRFRPLGRSF